MRGCSKRSGSGTRTKLSIASCCRAPRRGSTSSPRRSDDALRVEARADPLEELGLVSRLPGRPLRVRAARPDVAVDVLVPGARRSWPGPSSRPATCSPRCRPRSGTGPRTSSRCWWAAGDRGPVRAAAHGTREELLVFDRPPYVADPQRSDTSVTAAAGRRGHRARDLCARGARAARRAGGGAGGGAGRRAVAGACRRADEAGDRRPAAGDPAGRLDRDHRRGAVHPAVGAAGHVGAVVRAALGPGHADRGADDDGEVTDRQLAALLASAPRTTWSPGTSARAPARSAAGSRS